MAYRRVGRSIMESSNCGIDLTRNYNSPKCYKYGLAPKIQTLQRNDFLKQRFKGCPKCHISVIGLKCKLLDQMFLSFKGYLKFLSLLQKDLYYRYFTWLDPKVRIEPKQLFLKRGVKLRILKPRWEVYLKSLEDIQKKRFQFEKAYIIIERRDNRFVRRCKYIKMEGQCHQN